ncbi:MAG: TetR/AcrR family transcriptional regulator [Solirubrobacterales bacterium]|nr:TetR/AcrR family transcriptional regulator [Solirubrobacterales bacterium]
MADRKDQERPLRADARKNRERILEAAATVFARDGLDASLDVIAAEAGVGVGTVYRRFPERQDLIDELFEVKIERFVSLAEECAAIEDPWEGLTTFIRRAARMHGDDIALRQIVLGPGATSEMMDRPRKRLAPIMSGLIERAKAQGSLRTDFDTLDVPLIEVMLARTIDLTDAASSEVWERLLTLVIDGMRSSRETVTPMPVEPITPEQYMAAIAASKR